MRMFKSFFYIFLTALPFIVNNLSAESVVFYNYTPYKFSVTFTQAGAPLDADKFSKYTSDVKGFEQQKGLASLQPSLAATGIQQLGAAGTSNLAYQQALLDAARGQAQLAYQEPYTRLGQLGAGIASIAGGVPVSQTVSQTGGAATP